VPIDNLISILITEYHENMKLALFIVRAFYGARRPHAYYYRFFRKSEKDLFYNTLYLRIRLTRVIRLYIIRILPEARRFNAYRSIVWF
jgi:hypothetical protein